MKKLLHERLRDNELFPDYPKISNFLADEIEKYYIQRPRFEDGEPVQFGDETEQISAGFIAKVVGIATYNDGSFALEDGHGNSTYYAEKQPVKRPQQKVYDADGVEIKVGDTLWNKKSGNRYEVIELDKNDEHHALLRNCNCSGEENWHALLYFTHKEPDSLEKLRDDMAQVTNDKDVDYADMEAWINRLTILIERGA